MKKYLTLAVFVVLAVVLVSPISVSAKTKAGVKSGSFFYFFDKTFEKANLFFTFSPEKKAKKALENAEERLAEAEESASENNQEAVSEAMESYQKNIEVLEKVLAKVPEEAKEAIEKAIEVDKERREEMTKKIEDDDFKKDEEEKSNNDIGDNESGKEEVENENKDENKKDEQKKEIEKLKKEVETLKQKQPQVKIIEKIVEKPVVIESKQNSSSQIKQNENIITLPNGSVVEMDASGNVVRTVKEEPKQSEITPSVASPTQAEIIVGVEVVKKQESYSTKQVNENASLKITSSCTKIFPGTYCDVEVAYFENGQQKNISAITVNSNDNGIFIESSYPGITCIGALAANSDGSQRKGNPLTCATRPSPKDGKPITLFTYLPSETGTRILTATANGAIGTVESLGQILECGGVVRGEGSCQL